MSLKTAYQVYLNRSQGRYFFLTNNCKAYCKEFWEELEPYFYDYKWIILSKNNKNTQAVSFSFLLPSIKFSTFFSFEWRDPVVLFPVYYFWVSCSSCLAPPLLDFWDYFLEGDPSSRKFLDSSTFWKYLILERMDVCPEFRSPVRWVKMTAGTKSILPGQIRYCAGTTDSRCPCMIGLPGENIDFISEADHYNNFIYICFHQLRLSH